MLTFLTSVDLNSMHFLDDGMSKCYTVDVIPRSSNIPLLCNHSPSLSDDTI